VGEVDERQDSVDERVSERDERVDGTRRQADEEDVEELGRVVDEVTDEDCDENADEGESDDRVDARARPVEERRNGRRWFSAGLNCDGSILERNRGRTKALPRVGSWRLVG
jgi:hypothetical protein